VFLGSGDKVLVCTHATFRFAVDRFGVEAFDDRLIAVDEFHHVSADPDSKLGQLIARNKTHIVAMTGSYFRGDAVEKIKDGTITGHVYDPYSARLIERGALSPLEDLT
jgi:superfamily II DNA or RNA helicase